MHTVTKKELVDRIADQTRCEWWDRYITTEMLGRYRPYYEAKVGQALADAAEANHLGAHALGQRQQFLILRSGHQHLREDRLVAVDDDVDALGVDHAQVSPAAEPGGRAEEDVLQ